MTSHDVVATVRRIAGRGVKVGHAGTLDPFATGVLVVCMGQACRLADYVQAQHKCYRAVVVLGATSATDDPEGPIAPTSGARPPAEDEIRAALLRLTGSIEQVPPAHSAIHIDGRRAYKLARAGKPVQPAARTVEVRRIDLLKYEYPRLEIEVQCGGGTYIRAIARDIGRITGAGGYCSELTRTRIGLFTLDTAVELAKLDIARDLIPPLMALPDMPKFPFSPDEITAIMLGKPIPMPKGQSSASEAALVDSGGRLIAIARPSADGKSLRPIKVFPQ